MPGMIESVLRLKNYERKKSFLIGDKDTDVIAAERAGLKGFKFVGNNIFQLIKYIISSLENLSSGDKNEIH